ncbi:MAG: hypothetical protein K2M48_04630 [Clostridiales bacterium]|nr:hypothetical protein [Clostridiales bacterium]
MATRRTTRTTHTYTYTARAWTFKLAFWLVVIIGVAMAFVAVMNMIGFSWFVNAGLWIESICIAIALIIPVVMSYQVARHQQTWMFVLWIICVILIIFGVIGSRIGLYI